MARASAAVVAFWTYTMPPARRSSISGRAASAVLPIQPSRSSCPTLSSSVVSAARAASTRGSVGPSPGGGDAAVDGDGPAGAVTSGDAAVWGDDPAAAGAALVDGSVPAPASDGGESGFRGLDGLKIG